MLCHDAAANTQPQAHAHPFAFLGKEGREDLPLLILSDATAVIPHSQGHSPRHLLGDHRDARLAQGSLRLLSGFDPVLEQI